MKPKFNGYLKMFLHDDDPERLVSRAETTEDWVTKRWKILKKPRRFSIRFHIVDTDGNLGHAVTRTLDRTSIEGLVGTVTTQGNELAGYADRLIDIRNSCAVVRA